MEDDVLELGAAAWPVLGGFDAGAVLEGEGVGEFFDGGELVGWGEVGGDGDRGDEQCYGGGSDSGHGAYGIAG
jgi:hypothetical protein